MSAMAEEIPHPSAFIPEEQDVVEDVRLPRPPAMTAHSYEQQQLTLMQMADRYDTLGKSFLDMAKTLRGEPTTQSVKADKKGWASEDLDTIEQIVMANPDRVYDAREIKKTMLPHISVPVIRKQLQLMHGGGILKHPPVPPRKHVKHKKPETHPNPPLPVMDPMDEESSDEEVKKKKRKKKRDGDDEGYEMHFGRGGRVFMHPVTYGTGRVVGEKRKRKDPDRKKKKRKKKEEDD